MFRSTLPAALAALLLAGPALAQSDTTVSEVEVSVDLTAIQNPEAAAYWANLAGDLENAIVARVTDRTAQDGVKVSIDISEVELANSFQQAMDIADSRMAGRVEIIKTADTNDYGAQQLTTDTYELTVTFGEARVYLPEGVELVAVTIETPVYYDMMVEAFANRVVEKL